MNVTVTEDHLVHMDLELDLERRHNLAACLFHGANGKWLALGSPDRLFKAESNGLSKSPNITWSGATG